MAALLLLCSGPLTAQTPDSAQENPRQVADAIIKEAGQHLGKPYKYGGNGPESFDCTGFTCYVFKQFGYKLSRTSSEQAKNGREVKGGIEKYQKGDLVIFGGRSTKKTPGHVGIFIAADSLNKNFTFIHASSSGVTISHINEPYYAQRFLGVRRILPDFPPEEKVKEKKKKDKEPADHVDLPGLLRSKTGAARDSVINAVTERTLVLFPDGTWRTEEASSAEFYTVRGGDTLGKIARKFDISVDSLMEMNGLTKKSILHLGDRLRVR